MPKVNVYLPDELADAVRDAGIPISVVCQHALDQAVRRIADLRAAVAGRQNLDEALDRLPSFTKKARTAVVRAVEQCRAENSSAVGTAHVLGGLVSEGTNLALSVLRAVGVDPQRLVRSLGRTDEPTLPEAAADVLAFSAPAAAALRLAVTEAISLGHNYVGGEHLLLGLAADPDGVAGAALREAGAEQRSLRRAVTAAMAGYTYLRSQQAASPAPALDAVVADAVQRQLTPLVERLSAVEERLDRAERS